MRLCLPAAVLACALAASGTAQDRALPYRAYVTADEAQIRSGPGESFYPTEKVRAGAEVEVYRHDPGGWCAIRPLPESFSWVAGWQVQVGADGLGEITVDQTPSRVGSQSGDVREVVHVRLKKGEIVEVLSTKKFGAGTTAANWYRISPPSGEFRWIERKHLDTEPPRTARQAGGERTATVIPTGGSEPVAPAVERTAAAPAAAAPPPRRAPSLTRQLTAQEFQEELDNIDTELSIIVAGQPSVWNCDDLARRTEMLVLQAQTAAERGHARVLLNRVTKAIDVKQGYEALYTARGGVRRDGGPLAATRRPRMAPQPSTSAGRFDGVGKLTRVAPSGVGGPRYALVDARGNIRYYVTPAPGVNMQYYVGRQVGVVGSRSTLPDQETPYVTAKHVTPLEGQYLR